MIRICLKHRSAHAGSCASCTLGIPPVIETRAARISKWVVRAAVMVMACTVLYQAKVIGIQREWISAYEAVNQFCLQRYAEENGNEKAP